MDTTESAERLTALLRERVGDDLRIVLAYASRDDVEIVFARDDVLAQYSDEQLDEAITDVVMESFEKELHEGSFLLGELRCTLRFFDRGVVFHFVTGDGEGVAASIEPSALPDYAFLDDCIEAAGLE